MQLTRPQLEFLAGLSKSPTGRALVDLIQAKLAHADRELRTASGEEVFRAQGRAQALDEFLTDIAEASTRLERNQQVRRPSPAFSG